MKIRFRKRILLFLLIPTIVIFGDTMQYIESTKSNDGIYYLTVDNQSTKTAGLDKSLGLRFQVIR